MDLGLVDKHALVTGGTQGIGRAISVALAQAGASVLAVYRHDEGAADKMRAELATYGGQHQCVRADVTKPDECATLIDRCRRTFATLDVVVNNTGPITHAPYRELPFDEWQTVIDGSLTAGHLVTQASLPLMRRGGSVIFVGAAVAAVGVPQRAHYTAAKAALTGLTRSLSKELGRDGIRVNTIAPGVVDTGQAANLSPEHRKRYETMIPLGRLADPAEIAACVLFLAGSMGSYLNGATVTVDGGI